MAGCTTDVDGFVIGDCRPPGAPANYDKNNPQDVKAAMDAMNSEQNRRGDFAGYKTKDYVYTSDRKTGTANGMVAPFIDAEDVIPCRLVRDLGAKEPLQSFGGYKLTRIVLSDEALVYMKEDGSSAIICLVGQNFFKNYQHLFDDLNVAGLSNNASCNLRLVRVGTELVNKVKEFGIPEIIIAGFSLGGASAACIANLVTRIVLFNPGAPVTNNVRVLPANGKAYHIVGDFISTHFTGEKRIYLEETDSFRSQTDADLQTDGIQWKDFAYYHSMDRFMDYGLAYKIVDAQFEQNSLENYFFFKGQDLVDIAAKVAGILSVNFNIPRKLQLMICSNPIPGAEASRGCKEGGADDFEKALGTIIGGAAGGAVAHVTTAGVGTVGGATAGAAAGLALATGEKGILDIINPEIGKKASEYGSKLVEGISALDQINNDAGAFKSKIQYETPNAYTDGLVIRNKRA
jgi:hypothetical protein